MPRSYSRDFDAPIFEKELFLYGPVYWAEPTLIVFAPTAYVVVTELDAVVVLLEWWAEADRFY